ncbi:hypothetical protein IPJ70_00940 [Candidatus Campbellbacteria bacterium]|nr:MAG: hypothetical protein IPJ70_00940 [Candidatus Campbellbacteria bacterium]
MNIFDHHAYRIHGDSDGIRSRVYALVHDALSQKESVQVTYIEESEDTLSIDTVRKLHERLRTRVAPTEKRIVLIRFSLGTHEAQNALLKVCEEPGDNTILFLSTPSAYALLPTLHSRTQEIEHVASMQKSSIDIGVFVASPYTERFEMVQPLIEEKNKEQMVRFINDLEEYTLQSLPGAKKISFLHTLELVRSYVLERGCSPKLLLDLCAVYMPRTM